MMSRTKSRLSCVAAACALSVASFQASPEDIDIFAVDESNIVARPNVLFVVDNSANWSRASQQWPDGDTQGQSEAFAIKEVLKDLDASINVGLMEFITGGTATDQDSGYIRYHIRPMSGDINDANTNKGALAAQLTTIFNNINVPNEKRAQAAPFGTLFWDVYNYLAGVDHSNKGAGTVDFLADGSAYTTRFSTFQSPLTEADTCTRTVVVFIGNNVATGPTPDSQANVDALHALAGGAESGDAAVAQIDFADYEVKTEPAADELGYSEACYDSEAACTTALQARDDNQNNIKDCEENGYTSCNCTSATPNLPIACPSTHWKVVGTSFTSNTAIVKQDPGEPVTASTGDIVQTCITEGTAKALNPTTCPANTDVTVDNGGGMSTRTITRWTTGSCAYTKTSSCSSSRDTYEKFGTRTRETIVYQTTTTTNQSLVGESSCFNDAVTCGQVDGGLNCSGYNGGCECTEATTTSGCGGGSKSRYQQLGNYTVTGAIQKNTYRAAPTGPFMMDEWARFLRQTGVPIPGGAARSQVTTYTIDVFNAQQHPDFSGLLFNAARVGGGKYFQAKDQNALINALKQILTEVQAVNSAFSSASLPVNATNRAQNENQVFIGVFKPDRDKEPNWFGNLKRYQLISSGVTIDLGDAQVPSQRAINTQTGFITECAVSFWTTDHQDRGSGYWKWPNTTNPLPLGTCTTNSTNDLSDLPDGPFVEKGAVAEVLRKGNDPSATPDGDGNYPLNRTVYTKTATTTKGSVPPVFDTTNSGLSAAIVDYIRGHDTKNDDSDSGTRSLTEPRSNIHGDVIHSRPQPLNYGEPMGVVVYYGANDGTFRAVKAKTGQELWAFVAPEHYDRLARLEKNDPPIRFFNDTFSGSEPKDYFFDGSTGVYQTFKADGTSDTAYIFPTMRRGGRMLYAFDVSDPANPRYLWSKGCKYAADDSLASCPDPNYVDIGETWPLPNVALIKGYCGSGGCIDATTPRVPVIVMGGGYDTCDDLNTATPCAATKGRGVYVIDATTGERIKYFDFKGTPGARGIAADVALIDVDADKMVDYGYAVDTGGNIYRMDFVDTNRVPLASGSWSGSRVAYTQEEKDPRKFLFPPALVQATSGIVYLALGSGDREHPLMGHYPFGIENDAESAILNRFYVFKDMLSDVDTATALNLDNQDDMADYTATNGCKVDPILPGSQKKGWYIDLNANGQGEQTVTSAVIAAGFVFFSTNRPTPPLTTACSTSLGEARGYFVNLLNGSGAIGVAGACDGDRSSTFVGGGLPPSPVLATVPIEGQGLRTVVIGAVQKTGGPSSPIEAQRVRPPIASDRKPIYWYKSTGDR